MAPAGVIGVAPCAQVRAAVPGASRGGVCPTPACACAVPRAACARRRGPRRRCGAGAARPQLRGPGANAPGPAEGAVRPARRTHGAARSLLPLPLQGPPARPPGRGSRPRRQLLPASRTPSPPLPLRSCPWVRELLARRRPLGSCPRPGLAPQPPSSLASAPGARAPRRPCRPGHAVLPVPRRVPRRDRRECPLPAPAGFPAGRAAPAAARRPRPRRPSPPPRPLFARTGPGARAPPEPRSLRGWAPPPAGGVGRCWETFRNQWGQGQMPGRRCRCCLTGGARA